MRHTILTLLNIILICLLLPVSYARAESTSEPIRIYTAQDMLAIAEYPSGSYILMDDIDMSGISWPSIRFTGDFDGGGHALLNLSVTEVSEETLITYDGNHKPYDTHFGGLFSIMENASVRNLGLIGFDYFVTYEGDCFLGAIAGYAYDSLIENCQITGTVRLDVRGKMFGVGGIIGYGSGTLRGNTVTVTLINIDLDAETRDEEFLGGVCGAGYPDLDGNTVRLSGYLSDHGYVHSGGLIGMYIIFPSVFVRDGYIQNNRLSGYITFFEDNTNRRAYCEPNIGEVLDWYFTNSGNAYDFKRDERFDYTVDLLPHDSEHTEFSAEITEPGCDTFGYMTYTCTADGCGYSYIADYTLHSHPAGTADSILTEPSLSSEGFGAYICPDCGSTVYVSIPMLTPTPTAEPTPVPTATPVPTLTPASDEHPVMPDAEEQTDTAVSDAQSETGITSREVLLRVALIICSIGVLIMICFAVKTIKSQNNKQQGNG